MNTIGIMTKPQFPDIKPVLEQLVNWLSQKGKTVVLSEQSEALLNDPRYQNSSDIATCAELIIVLGGDGTMLSAARLVEPRSIPILGVNMGGLGFLTETTVENMYSSLTKVFDNHYQIDARIRLKGEILRQDNPITQDSALNDIVVSKGTLGRMIRTRISLNHNFITNIRGDGVIVSSPTGSTAYSMSAGGPILDPSLETLILAPINPHTLTHRPVLFPSHYSLEISLSSPERATVTFDGQVGYDMNPGDLLSIVASPHKTNLIRFPDRTYYDVLRTKLKWGDG
jgi:NAD+ kinase